MNGRKPRESGLWLKGVGCAKAGRAGRMAEQVGDSFLLYLIDMATIEQTLKPDPA
jgi:hypothetical protein